MSTTSWKQISLTTLIEEYYSFQKPLNKPQKQNWKKYLVQCGITLVQLKQQKMLKFSIKQNTWEPDTTLILGQKLNSKRQVTSHE